MSNFKANLRSWTIHVSINALPSFILATISFWQTLAAWAAMFTGILFYIFVLAAATSTKAYAGITRGKFLSDAMLYGKRARLVIAGLAVFGLIISPTDRDGNLIWFFAPDMFAGIFANNISNTLLFPGHPDDTSTYIPTLSVVLIEGAILICCMLILGLICSTVKKMYQTVNGTSDS